MMGDSIFLRDELHKLVSNVRRRSCHFSTSLLYMQMQMHERNLSPLWRVARTDTYRVLQCDKACSYR